MKILRDLGGLTASRFSDDNRCWIVLNRANDLLSVLVHRESAPLLFQLLRKDKEQIALDSVPFSLVWDDRLQRTAFRFRRTQYLSLVFSALQLRYLSFTLSST